MAMGEWLGEGVLSMCMAVAAAAAAMALLVEAVGCRPDRWWGGRTPRKEMGAQLPPGTMGWSFLGETLEFVSCAYTSRPEAFMDKRRLMYGKVFKSHIFGSPTVVSTDADVNRAVLQSDPTALVPSYPKPLAELVGESSILLLTGGVHRRMHALIGSFLRSPRLRAQVATDTCGRVESAAAGWRDGQIVRVQEHAKEISFQVLLRALISVDADADIRFVKQQFVEFVAGLMALPLKLPGTRFYRSLQAKKRMVNFVKDVIGKKRYITATPSNMSEPKDIADVLLNDGSGELTDDLIAKNMVDLMIPGEDSVPIVITLAVKYISECPEALRQLEEENLQLKHTKEKDGVPPSWADYLALSFTQSVISETLRMGNVIIGVIRKAVKDVEIKGYLIPKGWCVLTYFRSVHLDPDIYDDPYKFNPWRWQNKDMGTCNFTPFGGGQRLCPGLDLARLEASIFLHHLVTNFTWVAEEDTIVNFPTVRMKGGMPIRVKRRKP